MTIIHRGFRALAAGLLLCMLVPACGAAQSAEPALSLKETIELALKANLASPTFTGTGPKTGQKP